MKIKTILKIIVIIIIVASIGLNLYWVGWKQIRQRVYEQGVSDAVSSILFQVQNTGQVIITTQDGQMILVPK